MSYLVNVNISRYLVKMSVTKILQRKTKTNLVENLCIFLHFSQLLTKVT